MNDLVVGVNSTIESWFDQRKIWLVAGIGSVLANRVSPTSFVIIWTIFCSIKTAKLFVWFSKRLAKLVSGFEKVVFFPERRKSYCHSSFFLSVCLSFFYFSFLLSIFASYLSFFLFLSLCLTFFLPFAVPYFISP